MLRPILMSVWLLALGSPVWAQSNTGFNGYAFGAPGGATGVGSTVGTLQAGGGVEKIFGPGIGVGTELSAIIPWRNGRETIGLFSVNGSYHFKEDGDFDPFVIGGYSLLFRSASANLANFGGGMNYWFKPNMAFRAELRDHIHRPAGFTVHYWGVRLGLVFR